MKKNIKLIVVAVLLWVPLAYTIFIHSEDESAFMRIVLSVVSGPLVAFYSGLAGLGASAIMLLSVYLLNKLGWSDGGEKTDYIKLLSDFFSGAFGVSVVVIYYLTITNQHIFFRLYGGW